MNTLGIRAIREISPNVRGISRYQRSPSIRFVEMLRSGSANIIRKTKSAAVLFVAFFLVVTSASEGARAWLRHAEGVAEAARDFSVPIALASPRVMQPLTYHVGSPDSVGMLREQNRYRVDMTRENNRFVSNLLGHAERLTSQLSR